jgi:hypothetical protein
MYSPDAGRRRSVVVMMQTIKAQAFRLFVTITMLASSALVLEAGQRWRG